ncbi:MAG: hypothetical protein DIU78_001035 [Pseudomonadota bacterium]
MRKHSFFASMPLLLLVAPLACQKNGGTEAMRPASGADPSRDLGLVSASEPSSATDPSGTDPQDPMGDPGTGMGEPIIPGTEPVDPMGTETGAGVGGSGGTSTFGTGGTAGTGTFGTGGTGGTGTLGAGGTGGTGTFGTGGTGGTGTLGTGGTGVLP